MREPLPAQAFKNGRSLTYALNLLSRHQATPAAHAIATAIAELHLDYAAKLELLHAAQQHPIFQHPNFIRRFIHNIIHIAGYLINLRRGAPSSERWRYVTEPQRILQTAKTSLTNSRDKIILC